MIQKFWREWQRPIELSLLLLFVFFLPLREAPKNILWAAYVVTWIVNRVRERNFGGRWDGWDTLCALWIVAGYLSAIFAGIHRGDGNEVLAVNDLVKYVSLFWCLRRGGCRRKSPTGSRRRSTARTAYPSRPSGRRSCVRARD